MEETNVGQDVVENDADDTGNSEAIEGEYELTEDESVEGEEGVLTDEQLDSAKEEVKNTIKKFNLKVDGKDLEKEIDMANETELIKILQMAEMSQKRAQETADLRKKDAHRENQMNAFMESLQKDPEMIMRQMGIDPAKFAEDLLNREVEKMQLSPEERRVQELEAELNTIKAQKEEERVKLEEQKANALRDQYAADFERDIISALDEGQLPNSPHIINKMVDMMSVAIQNKIDVSFADLIPMIKEERSSDIKSQIQGMSADDLIQLLSGQVLNDIIVKKTPVKKKVVPPTAASIKDTGSSKEKSNSGSVTRNKSAEDFFRNLKFDN